MLKFAIHLDKLLARSLEIAVAASLAAAAGLGAYQVIMRFVVQQPSSWSEALTRTLLIWMVYLGAGLAVRSGVLVAVDIARALMNETMGRIMSLVSLLFSFVFFSVIAWYGYQIALRVRFQTLAGLEVSIAWAYAALPVGGLLAAIMAVFAIARLSQQRTDGTIPTSGED